MHPELYELPATGIQFIQYKIAFMKLARVKDKQLLAQRITTDDAACYDYFDSPEELVKVMEQTDNIWYHEVVTIPDASDRQKIHEKKLHYEIFVSGYLHFYDDVTRSQCIDHTLHFKWDNGKL